MSEFKSNACKKLPGNDFTQPDRRVYLIEDKSHSQNAKARASQAAKTARMSKPKVPESTKRLMPF